MRHQLLLFLCSLLFPHWVFPQLTLPDSTAGKADSNQVTFFYHDIDRYGSLPLHALDTSLTGFQNYNRLTQQSWFFATLGNIGSATKTLMPYPCWQPSGFTYGVRSYTPYLYQNDSVRYYRIVRTYTELFYVQGAKKELNFTARFSRNIYRSLNLGFQFHVSNSPGTYLQQKTNRINFYLTAHFFSKTKRYGVIANFLANRIKNEENGGIKYDSLVTQNLETNRQVIPVNLRYAENRVKESGFYMKHFFNLTRHVPVSSDSTAPARKRFEMGRLTYAFQYNRQHFIFTDTDADTGFFRNNHLVDSINTRDSIAIERIINEFSWTNPSFTLHKGHRVLQLEGKIRHQYIVVSNHGLKYHLHQYIPSAWVSFRPFKTLKLEAFLDYVFGDYNEGDASGMVSLSQVLGKTGKNAGTITLLAHYKVQKPGWFYEQYRGNNFRWDTAFKQQGLISTSAIYRYKFLSFGASLSRLSNFVYLDTTALPAQERDEIGYLCAWWNTDLDLWRFTLRGQFACQTIQGSNVIRLPVFIGNLTLYFTQPLFRGAAVIQPGLNFFYNTSYYAENYMPATRMFYLQDKTEIGNYLYMDVFLNVKVQRARFFVAYTHFNVSFMGRRYFMVPHYPMQDAAFKFGVSWRFHD